ncbi:lipid II flippase MurJ [Mammaliicoccus sciuri]|uniref:lipid II flippase MurJ n=1 Tax=Mammaliicoccus sciuri TaxID=1296 RepID=UPI0019548F39|nr:lipid II flippase MurJ [Mammaliicoccus sciuri]
MKKLISNFIILLSTTLLIKILNFAKEVELSIFYGTGTIVDNFVKLSIFPNLILNSIGPALGIYFLTKITQSKNNTLAIDFKKIVLVSVLLLLLAISNSLYLTNENFTILINSNVLIFLYLIQVVMVYYHQSFENFKTGALSSSIQALIILIVIFIGYIMNLHDLIFYSITIALIIQITILFVSIKMKNYNVTIINSKDKEFFKGIISIILGIGLIEVLSFITKYFIGLFPDNGYLSIFNYSYKLANLPNSIIVFSFISIIFPKLSKISKGDILIKLNSKLTNVIISTLTLFSIVCIIFSKSIVKLVYGNGVFSNKDLNLVSLTFDILMCVMIFVSVLTIQYRVLFLLKKFRIIIINSIFQITILVLLSVFSVQITNSYIDLYYGILITTFLGVSINYLFINIMDIWIVLVTLVAILIILLLSNALANCVIFVLFMIMLIIEMKNIKKGRFNYNNETVN